jgi:hypothetical protein
VKLIRLIYTRRWVLIVSGWGTLYCRGTRRELDAYIQRRGFQQRAVLRRAWPG